MERSTNDRLRIVEQTVAQGVLTLKVEVNQHLVEQAYRKVYKTLVKHVRVPGFRPGRAPLAVLSNAVGRENFHKEVRKELLPSSYYDAIKTLPLVPYSGVTYADEHLAQGEPFRFVAKVSVAPSIQMGEYRELQVKKGAPQPVTEEEVQSALNKIQRRQAHTRTADDGIVAEGDLVQMSVTASVEGQEFKLLSRPNLSLTIGEEEYLPGIDEPMVGRKVGEDFGFVIEIPRKETINRALAGKKVLVKGRVKSVQRVVKPPIDDELARDVGSKDLEDLRKRLRGQIEAEHERVAGQVLEEELKKRLADLVEGEPGEELVAQRVEKEFEDLRAEVKEKPYTLDEYLVQTGRDETGVRQDLRQKTIEDLKLQFALDEIAAQEALEVTDDEFTDRISSLAKVLKLDPEELLVRLDETGSRILERHRIRRDKAFAKILERYV